MRLSTGADLARWRSTRWNRLVDGYARGPSLAFASEVGYLVEHPDFGSHLVTVGGEEIVCAPPELEPARWQRLLIGQLLPLAAVLHGIEVFHASVVAREGVALVFVGGSGAGKSTIALAMAGRGAAFVSDDVAAITGGPRGPVAHPGAPLASVDGAVLRELRNVHRVEPVRVLGEWDGETRIELPPAEETAPVGAIFLLRPEVEGEEVRIDLLDRPSPRLLLGATFNPFVSERDRLVRQLETCAALSRTASIFEVRAPRTCGVAALTDAVLDCCALL